MHFLYQNTLSKNTFFHKTCLIHTQPIKLKSIKVNSNLTVRKTNMYIIKFNNTIKMKRQNSQPNTYML